MSEAFAPGWPGGEPRWTSSAKAGVGTALGTSGRLWFTVSHGIVNEVYYPRVDQACTRDMGLVVTDRDQFFSEEKRHAQHVIEPLAPRVPAFKLTNTCVDGRYKIIKEVIADPFREVLLQRVQFTALRGARSDYALYVLIAPHLGNGGAHNTAWVGDFKGHPMLFAAHDGVAMALACSEAWLRRSVGFSGISDGWQDLSRHKQMAWAYERAENGNVALTGEIDFSATNDVVLALGFGRTHNEAAHRAVASLRDGFDGLSRVYCDHWRKSQSELKRFVFDSPAVEKIYQTSVTVLRTHESAQFPGGVVASLSIPWGASKGDGDLGGYHLVWPRDLVETAGGLLAAGAHANVRRILDFLAVTQEADGHWPQNMWLDGTPYWHGVQLDETGFPILLVDLAKREGTLDNNAVESLWPMVRSAAAFIATNGPVTMQDRWEEDPGYSPFTLAVEIAALLSAADLADVYEPEIADVLRETADAWYASLDRWTYASGTDLAAQFGVEGYYVRIAPPDVADAASPTAGFVPIKNRPPGDTQQPAAHVISPDALALVRFGLRAPDDPRIVNTVKIVDAMLKVDFPAGPLWRRYNGDGYGEHEDGSPFDGTGIGRPWPLLAAERAHFELAANRPERARALLEALPKFANDGGMMPEQTWDTTDVPERELFRGQPSGSAMPLVWAHAEFIKLYRSIDDGRVFDMPRQTVDRYLRHNQSISSDIWRFNQKCRQVVAGRRLRVDVMAPAIIRWSADGWNTVQSTSTRDTGLGLHVAELDVADRRSNDTITFTFYWPESDRWEGCDFSVVVVPGPRGTRR